MPHALSPPHNHHRSPPLTPPLSPLPHIPAPDSPQSSIPRPPRHRPLSYSTSPLLQSLDHVYPWMRMPSFAPPTLPFLPLHPPYFPQNEPSHEEDDHDADDTGMDVDSDTHALLRASLRTGAQSRLRRRGAIRLSMPPLSPSSSPPPAQHMVLLCGSARRLGKRVDFSSDEREEEEPIDGCGAVVCMEGYKGSGEWAYVAPGNAKLGEVVIETRKCRRMGCGCIHRVIACRVCGHNLGQTTSHLCKLHSLRHSPSFKQRHRFLPTRVYSASTPPLAAYSLPPTPSTSDLDPDLPSEDGWESCSSSGDEPRVFCGLDLDEDADNELSNEHPHAHPQQPDDMDDDSELPPLTPHFAPRMLSSRSVRVLRENRRLDPSWPLPTLPPIPAPGAPQPAHAYALPSLPSLHHRSNSVPTSHPNHTYVPENGDVLDEIERLLERREIFLGQQTARQRLARAEAERQNAARGNGNGDETEC